MGANVVEATRRIRVRATPTQAFDVLADPRSNIAWDPPVVSAVFAPEDLRVGGRFVLDHTKASRIGRVVMIIEAFERPRLFAYRGQTPSVDIYDEFRIEPDGRGAVVTVRVVAAPRRRSALRLLFLRGLVGLMLALVSGRIARVVERKAARGG